MDGKDLQRQTMSIADMVHAAADNPLSKAGHKLDTFFNPPANRSVASYNPGIHSDPLTKGRQHKMLNASRQQLG